MKLKIVYYLILAFLPVMILLNSSCTHPVRPDSVSQGNSDSIQVIIQHAKKFAYAGKADSAIDYLTKETQIALHSGNMESAFSLLLETSYTYSMWQMFDSANNYVGKAAHLYEKYLANDTLAHSALDYAAGKIELVNYRLKTADSLFKSSIRLRTKLKGPDDTMLCPAYNDLGTTWFYQGIYDSAMPLYTKALELSARRKNTIDREMARYYHNNGLIRKSMGDIKSATEYYKKSFEILSMIMEPQHPDFCNLHRNLAFLFMNRGEMDTAMLEIELGEKNAIHNFGKNSVQFAELLELKAQVNYLGKNYDQANTNYETAIEIFNQDPQLYTRDISYVETGLGNLDMDFGKYDSARWHFEKAASQSLKYFPQEAGNAMMSVAYAYELAGKLKEAEREYKRANQLLEQYYGPSYALLGLGMRMLGTVETKLGHYSDASEDYNKSIQIFLQNYGEKSDQLAMAYLDIGNIYLKNKDYPQAKKSLRQALFASLPAWKDTISGIIPLDSTLHPDDNLITILLTASDAYTSSPDKWSDSGSGIQSLQSALNFLEAAIKLLEEQRNAILTEKDRLDFSWRISQTSRKASELCYELYQMNNDPAYITKGIYYTGKRKQMVLRSLLNDLQAKKIGGIPKSMITFEKAIRSEIASLQSLINKAHYSPASSEKQIRSWRQNLYELYGRMDSLEQIYQKDYPEYYKLRYNPENREFTAYKLSRDEVMLEFDVDSSHITSYFTTAEKQSVIRQNIDSSFFKDAKSFIRLASHPGIPDSIESELKVYSRIGIHLYEILLGPFRKEIETHRLIIIPDDLLGLLPFSALPVPGIKDHPADFSEVPFLARFTPVRYVYYSGMLHSGFSGNQVHGNHVLAIAPGYEKKDLPDKTADSLHFMPLPESVDEASAVVQLMGGKLLVGRKASRANFFRDIANYPVIHLSMHTLSDTVDPMNSALVFMPSDSDYLVSTTELYRLQLNGPLVVMSACNTGSGNLNESEGLINIARGFLYAGAGSMVLTLWDINDYSSSSLVKKFYAQLHTGNFKDIALQQARLKGNLLNDPVKAHPYFWAGYILIGDAQPLKKNKVFGILPLVLFSVLTIVLLLFILHKRKKNNHLNHLNQNQK